MQSALRERTPPDEIVSSRSHRGRRADCRRRARRARGAARRRPGVLGIRQPPLAARDADLPRECSAGASRSTVTPGDATVRRNSDLAIRASVEGFHPQDVRCSCASPISRSGSARRCRRRRTGSGLALRVQALRGARSAAVLRRCRRHAQRASTASTVVDLPRIERVRLTY